MGCQGRIEAQSPCTFVCVIDRTSDLCSGCLRTLDEIGAWESMSNEEKWEVLRLIEARRALLATPDRATG